MLISVQERARLFGLTLWMLSLVMPASAFVSTPGSGGSDGSGGASYSVPIVAPPGTAGFAPAIALNYSSWASNGAASVAKPDFQVGSRSGNGAAGVGWSISGLSVITRCPSTLSTDNATGAVAFDANDKFCLDGQRLVTIDSSVYGADQTEYRTEVETMTKIVSYGASGSGPAWFKVWLKSGLILELGNTVDSRMPALPNGSARAWAVNKMSDRFGNYHTVSWFHGPSWEFGPTRIDYTGNTAAGLAPYNSIRFSYATRPDIETYYVGSAGFRDEHRLTAIQTYADQSLVKDYRIAYDTGPTTGRSRISSITECAASGACLGPLNFSYEAGGGQVQPSPGNLGQGAVTIPHTFLTGDLNGDGFQDVLMRDSAGYWRNCYGPTLSAAGCSAWWGQQGNSKPYVLDYDGDGISDLAVHQYDGQLLVCPGPNPAPGQSTCFYAPHFNYPVAQYEFFVADVFADGRQQLVGWDLQSHAGIRCDIPNLASGGCGMGAVRYLSSGGTKSVQGDFDGDGRGDIISFGATEYRSCTGKAIASPAVCTTVSTGSNWRDTTIPIPGDFNGDGKTDIMVLGPAGLYFCPGPGILSAEVCSFVAGMSGDFKANWPASMAGDFNGDGVTDLLIINANNTYLCPGPGITIANNCTPFSLLGAATAMGVGDFNGDGSADVIATNGASSALVSGALSRPDLLVSAASPALNVTTTFTYRPLTDATVYTKGTGIPYPLQETRKPLHVLSQIGVPNGIGGTNTTSYRFEGARVNLAGRGFAGFETSRANDSATGRETVTRQLQSFPHEGRVHEVLIYAGGQLAYSKAREIANLNTIDNRPSSWVYSEVEISNGLDGKWQSDRRTYGYDGYLNVVCVQSYKDAEESTRVAAIFRERSCNYSTNDRAQWLIGQPLSTANRYYQGQEEVLQEKTYTPVPGTHAVQQSIREPSIPALHVVTNYLRDVFGNVTSVNVNPAGMPARTTSTSYESRGRFPQSTTNALNHTAQQTFDARFGTPASVTDPNGLTITWQYDVFGRKTLEARPDGTQTSYGYFPGPTPNVAKPYIAYFGTTTNTGHAYPTFSYFDALGRPILATSRNFADTNWIDNSNSDYDAAGRVIRSYLPYERGAPVMPYVETGYDALGRIASKTAPGKGTTSYAYSAQPDSGPVTMTATNARGHSTREVRSVRGDLEQVIDALNKTTVYETDPLGLTSKIIDSAGNQTVMTYNQRGWLMTRNDPDWGSSSNTYNALGQLVSTTDAKGQVKTMGYDSLGRKTSQVDATQSSTWTYDASLGIGKIASSTSSTGPQNLY